MISSAISADAGERLKERAATKPMISPPVFAAQFGSSVRLYRQYQSFVRADRHERGQFLVSEGGRFLGSPDKKRGPVIICAEKTIEPYPTRRSSPRQGSEQQHAPRPFAEGRAPSRACQASRSSSSRALSARQPMISPQ